MDFAKDALTALDEIRSGLEPDVLAQLDPLADELIAAQRIFLYGVGREGLMMRALAMRLFHAGLKAHVVGDMNCPPIADGDVLFVSAGPGQFSTVLALTGVAREAGARVICATAEPDGDAPQKSDFVFGLKAQTMVSDQGATASVLPMGSLYEMQLFFLSELLVLGLREKLGISADDMRANHTNLE